MEFITRSIERRLWPRGGSTAVAPPWIVAGRYAYALARDFAEGDLSMRAMSLVYTTMLAIVPLLAFAFSLLKGLGLHNDLEPVLQSFLTPLGPRSVDLARQIVGFVDNVSGFALGSISIAIYFV
jgi:membrane protein